MTKHLRMCTFVMICIRNEHFTEDCYEVSYRYEMLGAKIRKEGTKT